jgi:arylsulfatase
MLQRFDEPDCPAHKGELMGRIKTELSRREFIKSTGSAAVVATAALSLPGSRAAFAKEPGRYNILMIVTDQERYLRPNERPNGYELPGQERLASRGVVFENHHIASCVCTPSRAVLYTGQHIQKNGMFDNTNFPWASDLPTDFTTIGDILRRQGYYTAYKGKWHLTDAFETANQLQAPSRILAKEMEEYGFSDYFGIGDMIAHTKGGYLHDGVITSMTRSWLRGKATNLGIENKPWFMAVNLVNPHDVMYYNTDLPGKPKQSLTAMTHLNRDPSTEQFERKWDVKLPASRNQSVSGPGRPPAHEEFADARAGLVGRVPNEDARWRRLNNYYLNCIQDADRHILEILSELDDLGMSDNTIVVLTSDHGEHAGAHGLTGKGATGYREQQNVPLIIAHPGMPGGKHCRAVTSHLDIATTLVSLAGGDSIVKDALPGHDISPLLLNPESAGFDALRGGALFNYNMFAYQDADFLMNVSRFIREGGKLSDLPSKGWRPDLAKRGAIRSVFDGRYKLNRYFSPKEHHSPRSIEDLFANNDVELFDLESDPIEVNNLAMDQRRHGELLLAMNEKLNALIETEVGEDRGQMLPTGPNANWTLDPSVGKLRM